MPHMSLRPQLLHPLLRYCEGLILPHPNRTITISKSLKIPLVWYCECLILPHPSGTISDNPWEYPLLRNYEGLIHHIPMLEFQTILEATKNWRIHYSLLLWLHVNSSDNSKWTQESPMNNHETSKSSVCQHCTVTLQWIPAQCSIAEN